MVMEVPSAAEMSYTQYARLPHAIDSDRNDPAALRKAAQQFESLFIDMWLKSARQANKPFSDGNMLSSRELETQQQMFDHEMSLHLARQGGVGLADTIVAQLQGKPVRMNTQVVDRPINMGTPENHDPVSTSTASVELQKYGQRKSEFETPEEFVQQLLPIVERGLAGLNLPPLGVLSQAALETGWGRAVIADADGNSSFNLFGMKASDDELKIDIQSKEFLGGSWLEQLSSFAAYSDWAESIEGYVQKLTQNSRYGDVLASGSDVAKFAQAISGSGYATDPNYADKLLSVFDRVRALVNP